MCLTPIHLRTNAKYISPNGYKRFYVDVPCGKCAECQQMKKNEWYLRNYYESQLTWSNGGYILFDTLTYDDPHINTTTKTILGFDLSEQYSVFKLWDWMEAQGQHLDISKSRSVYQAFRDNDYTCFNYHDVQNFLKLLRIRLERSGYDVKHNLRYFLSSEYGHDETYKDSKGRIRKGTNRPHYHILFYVNDPSIDPITMSQYISDAWIYGRTDGYVYKGRAYVYNNSFGPKFIKDPNRLTGAQYYVSKYVCKDYEFSKQVDHRISNILTYAYGLSFSSKEYKSKKRELHRFMDQFHRQSLGFGFNALCTESNLETIWSRCVLEVPDKLKVKKSFPLPMYYIRKLFQKCVKDSEGSLHWVWTEVGKEWKKKHIWNTVDILEKKMYEWYDNLSLYLEGSTHFPDLQEFKERVCNVLEGRTFRDYAIYMVFYKGRVSRDRFDPEDIDTIIDASLSDDYSSGNCLREICPGVYDYDGELIDIGVFREGCVMSDDCYGDSFVGFDYLSQLYKISMFDWNRKVQQTYEHKLAEQKLLKSLGFNCSKRL